MRWVLHNDNDDVLSQVIRDQMGRDVEHCPCAGKPPRNYLPAGLVVQLDSLTVSPFLLTCYALLEYVHCTETS